MSPPGPSGLETKVDMVLVTQEEIKSQLKEMRGQCRVDMSTVYDRIGYLEKQDTRRTAVCETKQMSTGLSVAIVTGIFILIQAIFTAWPHIKGH
jgi:hypothetical protein